jgi:hypothetical protein
MVFGFVSYAQEFKAKEKPSTFEQITLPIDKNSGKTVFTEVITLDSVSAENLYNRARLFVSNYYKSSKTVTDLSDEKSSTVIIKSYKISHFKDWTGGIYPAGGFNYTLKVYCKENRYKYEISSLTHTGEYDNFNNSSGGAIENDKPDCGTMFITKKQWNYIKQDCITNIIKLSEDLKKAMSNKSEIEKKDW